MISIHIFKKRKYRKISIIVQKKEVCLLFEIKFFVLRNKYPWLLLLFLHWSLIYHFILTYTAHFSISIIIYIQIFLTKCEYWYITILFDTPFSIPWWIFLGFEKEVLILFYICVVCGMCWCVLFFLYIRCWYII